MSAPSDARARPASAKRPLLALCALVGLVLGVEGALHGMARHRAFAIGLGLLLCLPLALALVLPSSLGRRFSGLGKKLALAAASFLCAWLALEVFLRVSGLELFERPEWVADAEFGHRLAPGRGGIDALGFRNATVPDRADVVCIGDSQTYGAHVTRDAAFPAVLAAKTGRVVYSMSLGGWGPVQYRALIDRALEMRPEVVVVGLFPGNDIFDAHYFAGLERWRELRDPKLDYPKIQSAFLVEKPEPNLAMASLRFVVDSSRLAHWAYASIAMRLKTSRLLATTYWNEPGAPHYDEGAIPTLFTPNYRLQPLDLRDPRVRDGMRITGRCIADIAAACDARGAMVLLLLIPTKELCYERLLAERRHPVAAKLGGLREAETGVIARVFDIAKRLGIEVVDPREAIHKRLAAGIALWPPSSDGHLNIEGCALVAELLAEKIGELHR